VAIVNTFLKLFGKLENLRKVLITS